MLCPKHCHAAPTLAHRLSDCRASPPKHCPSLVRLPYIASQTLPIACPIAARRRPNAVRLHELFLSNYFHLRSGTFCKHIAIFMHPWTRPGQNTAHSSQCVAFYCITAVGRLHDRYTFLRSPPFSFSLFCSFFLSLFLFCFSTISFVLHRSFVPFHSFSFSFVQSPQYS